MFVLLANTPSAALLWSLLPREANTWRVRRACGPSAVEVLHWALFLREAEELLTDRFDEGGRGVAGLEVFRGTGRVARPRALQPPVGEVPGRGRGLPA